jgi:hypothetical protein
LAEYRDAKVCKKVCKRSAKGLQPEPEAANTDEQLSDARIVQALAERLAARIRYAPEVDRFYIWS